MIVVGDFRTIVAENHALRASCTIHLGNGVTSALWYEVTGLPPNAAVLCADAFLAPCLLFALKSKTGIRFDVPISDGLAHQVRDLAFIFGTQLSLDRRPAIEIDRTVSVERMARGGITGFSAGVDSWFSIKENFIDCPHSSKKLTHLVVNGVGANFSEHKKIQVLERARSVAAELDLGLIIVRSNVDDLLQMGFQKTHTARNGSVAHLLSGIGDTFYYSSTDTYLDSGVFPTYDMAYADTIILPLLSSDSMTLRSTGSSFSRGEKTRQIMSIPKIGERLDVCVNHKYDGSKINCGGCWKCLRTELTLEAFGALDQFEPSFDLSAYRSQRERYIRQISVSNKPTEREAFELAQKSGIAGRHILHRTRFAAMQYAGRLRRRATRGVKSVLAPGRRP